MLLNEKDNHLHTHFCPHRHSEELLEDYVAAGEAKGLKEMTFTEHAIEMWPEIQFRKFNTKEELYQYIEYMREFQAKYRGPMKVNCGLEFDYIKGREEYTQQYIDEFGPLTEDCCLSLHVINYKGRLLYISGERYIDEAVEVVGSEQLLEELYFEQLEEMMKADFGPYTPRKITHPTQLRLCHLTHPGFDCPQSLCDHAVKVAKETGCALELNMQGLIKPYCGEIYGEPLIPYIKKYDVPVYLASDAHESMYVADGFHDPAVMMNISWMKPYWEVEGFGKR